MSEQYRIQLEPAELGAQDPPKLGISKPDHGIMRRRGFQRPTLSGPSVENLDLRGQG